MNIDYVEVENSFHFHFKQHIYLKIFKYKFQYLNNSASESSTKKNKIQHHQIAFCLDPCMGNKDDTMLRDRKNDE